MRRASKWLAVCSAIFLLPVTAGSVRADDFVGLTWDMAMPAGDLADYAGGFTWRGFTFEGRHFVRDALSLGLSLNYNIFSQNTDELIRIDGRDISGSQFRVVYSLPLLATAHYYIVWDYEQPVDPYVGLGIGAYRMERRLDIGVYSIREKNWHFGLAPEIGLSYPFDFARGLYFNARYNYAFAAGGIGPYAYWGLNIGAYWRQ